MENKKKNKKSLMKIKRFIIRKIKIIKFMIKCLPLFISSIQACNSYKSTQAQNKIDEGRLQIDKERLQMDRERLQMEKEKNSTATSLNYN